MIAPRSCGCFSTEKIAHRRLFIPTPVRSRAVWPLANRAPHHTCMCAPRWQCLSAVHAFVESAIDQRASYLNPTVACAVLRRTATAMVAARTRVSYSRSSTRVNARCRSFWQCRATHLRQVQPIPALAAWRLFSHYWTLLRRICRRHRPHRSLHLCPGHFPISYCPTDPIQQPWFNTAQHSWHVTSSSRPVRIMLFTAA